MSYTTQGKEQGWSQEIWKDLWEKETQMRIARKF